MDAQRWHVVKDHFYNALDLEGDARRRLLHGLEAETRTEVEALLEAAEEVGVLDAPLDTSLLPTGVEGAGPSLPEAAPFQHRGPLTDALVGPYHVGDRIGQGGMGDVYRARRSDGLFDREVALKVIRDGADTAAVLDRFAAERRILGSLEHPGIARLIGAGAETEGLAAGRPWLALELVAGVPITEVAASLGLGDRVRLLVEVARAVHHAHRRLVVHRDLKPSNVLVVDLEGGGRQAKLLDFGIAKLLDSEADAHLTSIHERRPLTRAYAAPEQIQDKAVTTATDVYGLGLLLFEVVTGARPFATDQGVRALEDDILGTEAPLMSAASRAPTGVEPSRLRGDLDVICRKALAKEPDSRYASAEAFAADLGRWLAGEPIEARAPSRRYRAGRFVARHRAGVASTVLAVLAVAAGVSYYTTRLAQERDRAEVAASEAEAVSDVMVQLFDRDPFAASAERLDTVSVGRFVIERGDTAVAGLEDVPVAQARVLAMLARLHTNLGDTDRALARARRAVAIVDSLGGPPSASTAKARTELGTVLEGRGEYAAAELHYRRALEDVTEVYGAEHEATAEALSNLSNVLVEAGDSTKVRESIRLAERALEVGRRALGPDHIDIAQLYNNLSAHLYAVGRTEEAITHVRRALEIRQAGLGVHPLVGNAQSNLANYLHVAGRIDEAVPIFEDAIRTYQASLPADHPSIATPTFGLSEALRDLGRLRESEAMAREALRLDLASLPPGHPFLVYDYELLGDILMRRGRWADAEGELLEALRLYGDSPDPAEVAGLRASLGRCAIKTGHRRRAAGLLSLAVPHLEGEALARARADLEDARR